MISVPIDRGSSLSLPAQLCAGIRDAVLDGTLESGLRLPPTREWADALGVSRSVVVESYEILGSEGFLESRVGAGTFVARGARFKSWSSPPMINSQRADEGSDDESDTIDFSSVNPDTDLFPRGIWGRYLRDSLENPEVHAYPDPCGWRPLRNSLSLWLRKMKGLSAEPDRIIITSGSGVALLLGFRLIHESGSGPLILEDPNYPGIFDLAEELGIPSFTAAMDDSGLLVDPLPTDGSPVVTPSHHFPTGSVLSIQRRIALMERARRTDGYILENDWDSDFRYGNVPIPSLGYLDTSRVIHVGTFSESLFPAIRLGYLVVPPALATMAAAMARRMRLAAATPKQAALQRFIDEGRLDRVLLKARRRYQVKRDALVDSLVRQFGGKIRISGDGAGLFLNLRFFSRRLDRDFLRRARDEGLLLSRIDDFRRNANANGNGDPSSLEDALLLGFGALSTESIRLGVERLARVI